MGWRIGEILVKKKLITWTQLEDTLREQKESGKFTGEILVEKKLVPEFLLFQALAEQYNLKFVDLRRIKVNPEAVKAIPEKMARDFQIFPIECRNDNFILGISNPLAEWPKIQILKLIRNKTIRTVLCLPRHIQDAITEYYEYQPS